jgi:hypothetical protein
MEIVIALLALVTLAAVYAVVIWIDKPMPPGRPPSAPVALRMWNTPRCGARNSRLRFAPRWRNVRNEDGPPLNPRVGPSRRTLSFPSDPREQ